MRMIKENIRSSFNRAHKTYDQYCSIQNKICAEAIDILLINNRKLENIADFGCGTGESTRKLIQNIKYTQCYGMDLSEKLIEVAKRKLLQNVTFIVSDFDFPIFRENSFDLVFSNMAFQWSLDFLNILQLLNTYLNKDGILVFSLPVNDNFSGIKSEFKLEMLEDTEVVETLEKSGFELIEQKFEVITENFPNKLEAIRSLKRIGANCNKFPNKNFQLGFNKIKLGSIFFDSAMPQLTYKIGIFMARKR